MSDNKRHDSRMDSVYLSYLPDESGTAAKAAMQGASPVRQQQPQQLQQQPSGIRPLQLRQPQPAQSQSQQQHQQMQRPNIPVLQVTVPSPVHAGGNGNGGYAQIAQGSPSYSPYPPSTPRSPSPFSQSTDTLVGSPNAEKKQHPWSPSSSHSHGGGGAPPMSPSIKNLQLAIPYEDKTADPDNDRLMPATPGLGGQKDWWKRFSTVVRENQQQEMMAEKMNGSSSPRTPGAAPHVGASNRGKPRSQWVDKEVSSQRSYRIWVGVVAFLIIAAIAGALAYHYVTKNPNAGETLPGKKDFGLGTLSDADSQTQYAYETSTSADDAGSGAAATAITSQLPAPSAVAAGATLGRRELAPTTAPCSMMSMSHGHEKRRMGAAAGHGDGAAAWRLD